MYSQHFGFHQHPFSLSPDTDQFVNLHGHKECFEMITYALSTGEGFVKVVGDVGTGKTILCRKLLRYLKKSGDGLPEFVALYIPNPLLSPTGLFRALANELGIPISENISRDMILEYLNNELLNLANNKKSIVIIVDEAQALPEDTLEALRLITNLETEKQKLVQIILFGQTELEDLLSQYRFRQLKQRITFSYELTSLSKKSTEHYIRHRTMKAGYSSEQLFADKAIRQIHKYSKGVPRLINVLAHKALLSAFGRKSLYVSSQDVIRAWNDESGSTKNKNLIFWIMGILLVLIVVLLALFQSNP